MIDKFRHENIKANDSLINRFSDDQYLNGPVFQTDTVNDEVSSQNISKMCLVTTAARLKVPLLIKRTQHLCVLSSHLNNQKLQSIQLSKT